jgi:hypothetical protein
MIIENSFNQKRGCCFAIVPLEKRQLLAADSEKIDFFNQLEKCQDQLDATRVETGVNILNDLFGELPSHDMIEACVAIQLAISLNSKLDFAKVLKAIQQNKPTTNWKDVKAEIKKVKLQGVMVLPKTIHSLLQNNIESVEKQLTLESQLDKLSALHKLHEKLETLQKSFSIGVQPISVMPKALKLPEVTQNNLTNGTEEKVAKEPSSPFSIQTPLQSQPQSDPILSSEEEFWQRFKSIAQFGRKLNR